MIRPNEWTEYLEEAPGMTDLEFLVYTTDGEVLFHGNATEMETGHYSCGVILGEDLVGVHVYLQWKSALSGYSSVLGTLVAGTKIQADMLSGYAQQEG